MSDLSRLLRPRSVTVLGGKQAAETVRQLRKIGYDGAIWPVHPRHAEVAGERAFPSIAALPAAPDAAFIGINRHATIAAVEELAARGAGGAVVHAAGFAETGAEGEALQRRLDAAAGALPYFGPNCYGFINYLDGVSLWPDQHGGTRVERGVAILTQSGNIGLNLTMQRRAVPIAYLLTLGNQARIDIASMIEALVADGRVTVIGLHLEGIGDPERLARAAAQARDAGVPIVALKTGNTEAGAHLAVSHTASLAGAAAVVEAYLRRIGIVPVRSIPVLLETLKILHMGGPLAGRDIASMSCSGGEAALMADAIEGRRLRFRPLGPEEARTVRATLSELVTISNPLDYHTFIWADEPALTATFTAVMRVRFAVTLLILDFPRGDRCSDGDWRISMNALTAAARKTGGRAAVLATLPEAMPEEHAEALAAAGIVPLLGIDEALAALEAAADAGEVGVSSGLLPTALRHLAPHRRIGALSEWQGKRLLADNGFAVPEGRLVRTPEEAVEAAAAIGFPVVVKAVGASIAHKTEIGAVRLGLGDATAAEAAARALIPLGEALLVERMIADGIAELILGIARDPAIGLYLVVGSGGVLAELVGDRRVVIMPAAREEIGEALTSLKAGALLAGHRGRPKGDLAAAIEAVLRLQEFALANADRLIELDINPLIVRAEGRGAVAADVFIRLAEEDPDG